MSTLNSIIKQAAGARKTGLAAEKAQIAELVQNGSFQLSRADAVSAISMESLDSSVEHLLASSVSNLNSSLESLAEGVGMQVSVAGKEAATIAGIAAFAPSEYVKRSMGNISLESGQAMGVVLSGENASERVHSLEAYDEAEARQTTIYSVLYNLRHGNQDRFAEAFFPTVVVPVDQLGYTVSINLVTVYDEVRRDISGKQTNFGRRNIIHALTDPSILRNDQTRIYPVARAESANVLVAASDVAPRTVEVEGIPFNTAPIKIGAKLDLLGVSHTEALLETGIMDSTDAIAPAVHLERIYVKLENGGTTEVVSLSTFHLPFANFAAPTQGSYRDIVLNFDTKALGLAGKIKTVAGADSALLAAIDTQKISVRLGLTMNGKIDLEIGDTTVTATGIDVVSITDETGTRIAKTDAAVAALVQVLESATVIGYDLNAYRTNSNRRQRGQLLDTRLYAQQYPVKLRAPITVPRPQIGQEGNDAADIAALLTATGIRTTNAAIDTLTQAADILREHVANNETITDAPTIMGVAYGPVKAFYDEIVIDVHEELNSISSTDKASDVRSVLVNRVREAVVRMYTESGYQPAADALAGGQAAKPTVLVGTDPIIANWLMIDGDPRTLGPDFQYEVVTTQNIKIRGKIYVTFVNPVAAKEGRPDPLSFGNMAWKPELVVSLPTYFNGANSKQITVQPSFSHVVNLPCLLKFHVTNLPEAVVRRTPMTVNGAIEMTGGSTQP